MNAVLDTAEPEVLDAPVKPPVVLSKVTVYNPIEQGIAMLLEAHGHVLKKAPDVSTPVLFESAKKSKRELVKFRTAIEAARVKEKKASLEYGRLVDSEAERITLIAAPIEKAYDDAITAEEKREQDRKDGHTTRIAEIRETPMKMLNKPLTSIEEAIASLEAMPADFQEFQPVADRTRMESLVALNTMAEQQRALARQKQELEEAETERKRVEAIRARIAEITGLVATAVMARTSERLVQLVARCTGMKPDETFQELQVEAQTAYDSTLAQLQAMHQAKLDAEAAAEKLAQQQRDQDEREAALKKREAATPAVAPTPSPIIVSSGSYSRRFVASPVAAPVAAPTPAPAPAVDWAPQNSAPATAEVQPVASEPSDAELMDVAAYAVSQRFGLTNAAAIKRLAAITWTL